MKPAAPVTRMRIDGEENEEFGGNAASRTEFNSQQSPGADYCAR
jgi:hypothetical protein